ncbi:MAG: trypsin-like serine protease [Chloroflexi bacterium]|nr:trypsin-like serine protease [Chloroflexota bacterium]
MRKLTVLMILLLVLIVWVTPATAIVYGGLDGDGHPNVGLISLSISGRPAIHIPACSGVLIHPRVFLTAGHCTAELNALIAQNIITKDNVKVSFDPDDALTKKLLDVKDIFTHPEFNDTGFQPNPHDVGVLILSKPVKNIKSATLPAEGFLDTLQLTGTTFTVVGYGATRQQGEKPSEIKDPDGKRRVAESGFQTLHEAQLVLSQNQATDNAGTCSGDSGGPAFWRNGDGTETLAGIVLGGDPNCVERGTYYRADISDTLGFINDVINSLK